MGCYFRGWLPYPSNLWRGAASLDLANTTLQLVAKLPSCSLPLVDAPLPKQHTL